MSLVIVLTIEGFSGPTSEHWLRSSLFAFFVGYPTSVIITPLANKAVGYFIENSNREP